MNLILKPVIEPNESSGNANVYWLLFQVGEICRPLAAMSDFEMCEMVNQYCEFHRIELSDKAYLPLPELKPITTRLTTLPDRE